MRAANEGARVGRAQDDTLVARETRAGVMRQDGAVG